MGTECQNDVVLDFNIFRICQILNLEELLDLLHTLCGKIYDLVLLIHDEVSGLFPFHTHDGIHLGQVFHIFTTLHLPGEDITDLIKLG